MPISQDRMLSLISEAQALRAHAAQLKAGLAALRATLHEKGFQSATLTQLILCPTPPTPSLDREARHFAKASIRNATAKARMARHRGHSQPLCSE